MRSALAALSTPSSLFARAAACLTLASATIKSGYTEMARRVMGKFSFARAVWMPQYAVAGTSMEPRESVSVRTAVLAEDDAVMTLISPFGMLAITLLQAHRPPAWGHSNRLDSHYSPAKLSGARFT